MISVRLACLAFLATALSCSKSPRPAGPGPAGTNPAASATVGLRGHSFRVKVLETEKERRHALEELEPVSEKGGVLLAWPRERYFKLETEDARASFDAVFLDRSGKVVDVQPLKAGEREGVMSGKEAACALLLTLGRAAAIGVLPGDAATLPALQPQELPTLKVGGATAYVELALTEPERQHGLMFRPRMSAEDGMLFAYENESPRRFWMGNTLIPLDLAFFKDDGTLVNVNETPKYPDPRHPPADYATSDSQGPCRFVLEMNLGWFRKNGLLDASGKPKPGIKIDLPPEARKGFFE